MNKRYMLSILVCMILLGQCLIMAQTSASPKVLWIFREDVKVAKGAIHNQVEHGFAQLWAKAQTEPFLAMEAMFGNPNEVVFISGYDSFASFEKDYQAYGKAESGALKAEYDALAKQEAELVNTSRSLVAIYRPELSYRADRIMPDLPKMRYTEIAIMRTRPGKAEAFAAGVKHYQDAYARANIETPWAVYEVMEGASSGTYLVLTPYQSLKEVDNLVAMEPKIIAAMGEEVFKNLNRESADFFISTESNMYTFSPKMSHVSKEFAAADPEFWSPKAKEAQPPSGVAKKPAK